MLRHWGQRPLQPPRGGPPGPRSLRGFKQERRGGRWTAAHAAHAAHAGGQQGKAKENHPLGRSARGRLGAQCACAQRAALRPSPSASPGSHGSGPEVPRGLSRADPYKCSSRAGSGSCGASARVCMTL